jgi:hypothetical protein
MGLRTVQHDGPFDADNLNMPEREYRVSWYIDLSGKNSEDVARQALAIQRDPESIATVFVVEPKFGQMPAKNLEPVTLDVEFPDSVTFFDPD